MLAAAKLTLDPPLQLHEALSTAWRSRWTSSWRELELLTKKAGEGEWVQTVVPKLGV